MKEGLMETNYRDIVIKALADKIAALEKDIVILKWELEKARRENEALRVHDENHA